MPAHGAHGPVGTYYFIIHAKSIMKAQEKAKKEDVMQSIINAIPNIHREGVIFVILFAVVTFIMGAFSDTLGWLGTFATLWCAYFFRDPERVTPQGEQFIISPGDGVVSKICEAPLPAELEMGSEERTRISIFLNIFNVHINRVPVAGKVSCLHYHPGKFFNAELDKASEHNERQSVCVTTPDGKDVVFVQIAGLIARRIVCTLRQGQDVGAGERYGLIRFGSRVDVYLPKAVNPLVVEGQTVIGGETILADMKSFEKTRTGKKH
jgi:phosphatidylserine decarboxylase